jgi:hypothetical protein
VIDQDGQPVDDPADDGDRRPGDAEASEPGPRDAGATEQGDHSAHHAIEERAPADRLPELTGGRATGRPPRRVGVFLDPEDLRTHVGELLRAILGGYEVDAFGNFTFAYQDARVVVTVGPSPVGPQVGVFSVTNLDLDLDPELGRFLLTTNHTLGFGSFSYDEHNRAIWLRHTLLGTTLDLPELHSAVAAVATTAAHFDDAIAQRFGGRTFGDAPDDVRGRMEPPEPDQTEHSSRHGVRGYL